MGQKISGAAPQVLVAPPKMVILPRLTHSVQLTKALLVGWRRQVLRYGAPLNLPEQGGHPPKNP